MGENKQMGSSLLKGLPWGYKGELAAERVLIAYDKGM